jgi:uncharacterized membrane protein YphA (DoxX/SURF4 family)
LGLLLLRVTVGVALFWQGARSAGEGLTASWSGAIDLLAVLCGGALVAGILTPASGVLAAAASVIRFLALTTPDGDHGLEAGAVFGLLFVMAATVALLGPGAYSLDARLFGRREIVLPRVPRSG